MTTTRKPAARGWVGRWLCLAALAGAAWGPGSLAAEPAVSAEAPSSAPTTKSDATVVKFSATQPATLPHIRVDPQKRFIDVEGHVIVRDAKWLELLACTPKSREHEALLTVDARPSHIHLALLLLGLEPGSPLTWKREGEKIEVTPPHGPRVAVTLIYEKEGKPVEVPANKWVVNQKTHEVFAGNIWLFAGSKMVEYEGQSMYLADANGTAIALVNFGDDLLTRDTKMTNQSDDETWGCNTAEIPPVGTAVTMRIRPVKEAAGETGAATQPGAPGATKPAVK
ncbi:MAG: YdjY domain-containing protein [Planctomycetota bacterium]|nr:YdjY domain-containing protein [Planctomycetota bacterium]